MSIVSWSSESKAYVTEGKQDHLKCYDFVNTEQSDIFANIVPPQVDESDSQVSIFNQERKKSDQKGGRGNSSYRENGVMWMITADHLYQEI